jgi:chromosome partitioning protein
MPAIKDNRDLCLSLSDLALLFEEDPKKTFKELEKVCGKQTSAQYILPQTVRKFIYSKGVRLPSQVISLQMLKGGVAKTTTALNIGLRAAMYGAKVLFIDLDQQANLTFALGIDSEELPVWVDIVEKKVRIQDAVRAIEPGVDLIPSSLNNSVLDRSLLAGNRNWAQAVKGPLQEIRSKYDLVIMDTAPSLSAINTAVTCASDVVILPINPDKFSLLGVRKHLQDLKELRSDFGLDFEAKVLFTRFDGRESSSHEILQSCTAEFEQMLMKSYVRTSTDIKNTIGTSKNIYRSKSAAKEDYDLVTREILGI